MSALTKKLADNVVTVFNGGGFLSRYVIARMGRAGAQVVIAYRGAIYNPEKFRIVGGLGQVYFAKYHLKDEESLHNAMQHSNIVVNCIGKMNETRNFSFEELYIEGSRRMARVARQAGVKKFIHVSALNVTPNPEPKVLKHGSQWLRTKYFGELAVREEFPEAIIFRPSDIIGEQDAFINHYTGFLRTRFTERLPVWDYYDGVVKQPIYVRDVAKAIEYACYSDSGADGKTFQAVGPYLYDLYELIEYIRTCAGVGERDHGAITNLRWDILRFVISIAERYQKYPFCTWERIERDCTSDFVDPKLPTLKDLGIEPTPLEELIKMHADKRPRAVRVEIPFDAAVAIDLPKRLNQAAL